MAGFNFVYLIWVPFFLLDEDTSRVHDRQAYEIVFGLFRSAPFLARSGGPAGVCAVFKIAQMFDNFKSSSG